MKRAPDGDLIIMTPMGGEGGNREANLIGDVIVWNRQIKLGVVFSSQTVFSLPGGRDRSPDVAWVQLERWQRLSQTERQGFPPICPDFVMELRARSESLRDGKAERLKPLQEKMQEYMDCGLQLGWLFDPQDQQVEIYRAGQAKELLALPTMLSGEAVLPEFELQVERFTD